MPDEQSLVDCLAASDGTVRTAKTRAAVFEVIEASMTALVGNSTKFCASGRILYNTRSMGSKNPEIES